MFIAARLLRIRFVVILALALVLASVAYGFAAANTVPTSNAGDGSATISGYTITAVHYTLNATNPANLDSVSFTIAPAVPAGGAVAVKLVSTGTTYTTCTVATGGTSASCTLTGVTALSANELRVIAAQ